jgi:hypothetical protein
VYNTEFMELLNKIDAQLNARLRIVPQALFDKEFIDDEKCIVVDEVLTTCEQLAEKLCAFNYCAIVQHRVLVCEEVDGYTLYALDIALISINAHAQSSLRCSSAQPL